MNMTSAAALQVGESAGRHTTPHLLTTKEAAAFLRVHYHTLEVWRSTGRYPGLPFVRVGRHAVRYRMSDLERFVGSDVSAARAAKECGRE